MKRKSVNPIYSMVVQPAFIIGTNNEDGTDNFAPITWVSATHEEGDRYLLVISMAGTKRTKMNVLRTGIFSVNLVNQEMLSLMDYFGTHKAQDGVKNEMQYKVSRGENLNIPVCFLQQLFGQSCKPFLDIVACPNWTKLQRLRLAA